MLPIIQITMAKVPLKLSVAPAIQLKSRKLYCRPFLYKKEKKKKEKNSYDKLPKYGLINSQNMNCMPTPKSHSTWIFTLIFCIPVLHPREKEYVFRENWE